MKTIYLVRHGETEWNASGRYQGFTDVPLNGRGLRQAEACAEVLANVTVHRVISSDLVRAQVTAETIAKKLPPVFGGDVPLHVDSRLREINFGRWESLTYEQIESKWPGAIDTMYRKPAEVGIEGGESFADVQVRAWEAVRDGLASIGENETLLTVCHGGTIRTILCRLIGVSLNHCWNFAQGNTAITKVSFGGEEPDAHNVITMLNDTRHIAGI